MRSPLSWLLLLAVAAGLAAALLPGGDGDRPAAALAGVVRVERVVDGDTVVVRAGGRLERVRYIGVDTPESVKPGVPVQCWAKRASRENAALVAGRPVRLVLGREPRDRYGRLLAYVYRVPDGLLVNERLVRDGAARTLTIAPNTALAARLAAVEAGARAAGRGLWGACDSPSQP